MKITNKEIKQCDTKEGNITDVLEIEYTHRGETWKILIRDYNPELEDEYFQELRKQVRELYTKQKLKLEA